MKENVEIPAAGLEPRGEITIEIFDEKTGDLVSREKKTNFVHDSILKAMTNLAARAGFTLYNQRNYGSFPPTFLNSVVLTDYAGAPSPSTEVHRQGNVIAYGVKESAAGNLQRGAWNANESILRADYLKLIFDFATSQGNGTFQSIYTQNTDASDVSYTRPTVFEVVSLPFTYTKLMQDAGKLYFVSVSKVYVVEKLDYAVDVNGKMNCEYQEIDLAPIALQYAYGLVIANNHLYISAPNYSPSSKIWKVPLSDPAAKTEIETGVASVYYMAYDRAKDQFIVQYSMDPKFHIFDRNWNKLEVLDTPGFSGITGVSNDGKFWYSSEVFYERATGLVTRIGNNSYYNNYTVVGDYAFTKGDSGTISTMRILARPLFFSRALLDSPVTKTAQQNMKITYEFVIPKINLML